MKTTNWNDYKALLEQGYELIDIRDPHETELGFVPGATLLPIAKINDNPQMMNGKKALIYCASGRRSQFLIEGLVKYYQIDTSNIYNVEGGYNLYNTMR